MEKVRLGDVCEILNGFAFKSNNYANSGIRIIRIANVQKGYIEDIDPAFYPIDSVGLEKYMLEEGDLLVSLTGNVGRVAVLEKKYLPAALNQRVACLRLKSDTILKGYLFHLLNSDYFEQKCIQASNGVAQKNMSTEWLKSYKITLHSKKEQASIEKILDIINSSINLRKSQKMTLDTLVKSRFIEMFGDPVTNPMGWERITLGDAIQVKPQNGLYKPQFDYVNDNSGTPILRIDAFYDGKVKSFSDLKRLNCTPDEIEFYLLKEGDIVINRVNSLEYLGKCAHITGLLEDTVFESNMMRFHMQDVFNPVYVTYLLCSQYIKNQIMNCAKKAVNQASINQKDVQGFIILKPPIDLQNQFAAFVQQVDKSKLVIQKLLEKQEILRAALMQEYFG